MNSKLSKLKTNSIAIFLVLLMTSITLIATNSVQAQTLLPVGVEPTNVQSNGSTQLPSGVTPDHEDKTWAYLSFRPTTVGVGQTVLVNLWICPSTYPMQYLTGYTVTIAKPNGDIETKNLDSYPADATAWFEYTPDQVGTYKLKFDFPGGYFPAGNYTGTTVNPITGAIAVFNFNESAYLLPSSTEEQILTVQDNIIASWPESSLPTDYWTRPISPENREWWVIAGNYPWNGPGGGPVWDSLYPDTNTYYSRTLCFTPYVQAPNSPHVVWKRQGAIGGLIGGDGGIQSFTSGGGTPSIIFEGRGYQSVTKPINGVTQSVWQCYDIRTGEVYWERTGVSAPTNIEYSTAGSAGSSSTGVGVTDSVNLVAITGNRLIKYDPSSGALTLNVSIQNFAVAPGSLFTGMLTNTYYRNGYALSVQDLGNENYRLINWTTFGSSPNFSTRIQSNVSWPWLIAQYAGLGDTVDYEAGIAVAAHPTDDNYAWPFVQNNPTGAWTGSIITAASLETGKVLWNITIPESLYTHQVVVADQGKVAAPTNDGYLVCYDINSGELLWKSEAMDYPWSVQGFGAYAIQSAYGMIYREAYDGVYAFDWNTGKIVWHYEDPTNPFETPYIDANGTTVNAFVAGGIVADGKLYTYNTEHSSSQPITRGWKLHCINITTGEGIWNITGSMNPGAVADGYLAASNSYDGYMYVFGKGQSSTAVSAPQTAITQGQSIVITGTVLDQSPGQPGTPCVSKDSMTTYMEYLHMQKPIDGMYHNVTVTGVPVSIDAVDPNGNSVHIATVTSDMSGTFSYTWTPTIAGDYTITATFMGDDSYGSSWAETHAAVVEAPAASPTSTPISFDAINNTIMTGLAAVAVAIIIAIAIVGLLILRKRP